MTLPTTAPNRQPPLAPILPFWKCIGAIASYPLRGAALASMAVLTLGVLLTGLPGIGWLVDIVLWLAAYKYAFEILRVSADGRVEAPEVVTTTEGGTVLRFLAMQFVFVGLAVLLLVAVGPLAALIALAVVALAQPGAIISLAIDGSLPHALNPSTWLSIFARVGWPYLVLVGLFVLFQASAGGAQAWLDGILPGTLAAMAARALTLWALFATFRLMGYVVLQYHHALGWIPEHRVASLRRVDPDHDLLERAEAAMQDGRAGDARALLEEELRTRAVSIAVHARYRQLLRDAADSAALAQHARGYLQRLLLDGEERRALDLLREQLAVDPSFAPLDAGQQVALLAAADRRGDSDLALRLRLALYRTRPADPQAAHWATAAARLMVEKFSRDRDAAALLDASEAAVGDDALRDERRRLRALLAEFGTDIAGHRPR